MTKQKRAVTIEVDEGVLHGTWLITARDRSGEVLLSTGTLCYDTPRMNRQQKIWLAAYLTDAANEWLKGNRDSPEEA